MAMDRGPNFYNLDCKDWFKTYAANAHGALFLIVCWCIWKGRNAKIFSDLVWTDWYMINYIHTLHNSIHKAFGSTHNSHAVREVKWNPPADNFIKLNVDGSSFGSPGRSGFGGIFRNSSGEWISGFTGFCGVSTNLNAELLAIYHGFMIAWRAGYTHVICEYDSLSALALINEGVNSFHPFGPLIFQIQSLKSLQWSLFIQHTLREGNECAEWMAKTGASRDDDLKIWETCPPQLNSIMLAYAFGVIRLRP